MNHTAPLAQSPLSALLLALAQGLYALGDAAKRTALRYQTGRPHKPDLTPNPQTPRRLAQFRADRDSLRTNQSLR